MGNGIFVANDCRFSAGDIGINNLIMRALGRIVAEISDLDEWEFKLEDQKVDEESPHYVLNFTSSKGKGNSCASEKMYTLRNHPEISHTREMKNHELKPGEVCWYGGIRVSYVGYEEPLNLNRKPIAGEVRMVFSGAREAIDLVVVLEILRTYIKACDALLPEATYLYDLESLGVDQLSGYLMKNILK